jgi:hypothetical protein
MTELVRIFEELLPTIIDENGFSQPPLVARHHDGTISIASMALPGGEIFRTVLDRFMTDLTVSEMIFGIDRYTQPDQGTKYADVLTVFWWVGERTENFGFRFGVVDYVPPPEMIIEPINWDNAFWNDILFRIVSDSQQNIERQIERYRLMNPEQVAQVEAQVMAAAKSVRGF